MKENRAAIWAILGVVIGFGLPILACMGLTLVFTLSVASLGSQGPTDPNVPLHVSGPLTGPAVAIIEINGPITSGEAPIWSMSEMAAADDVISLIHTAAEDSDVRAIMLAVNSPGGSAVPSDEIYHALMEVRIPIIVVMGDVAASGGYYLSMAADYIYANPNTLTGSIGVITEFPDAHELLEKIGVKYTIIKSGENKDFGSPYRPMTPEEEELWQELINDAYLEFVAIVAEGRGLSETEVREVADGRIFSGRQALELGLVDALGYREDGIAKAAELGGIRDEIRVIRYRRYTTLTALLRETISTGISGISIGALRQALSPSLEFRWVP